MWIENTHCEERKRETPYKRARSFGDCIIRSALPIHQFKSAFKDVWTAHTQFEEIRRKQARTLILIQDSLVSVLGTVLFICTCSRGLRECLDSAIAHSRAAVERQLSYFENQSIVEEGMELSFKVVRNEKSRAAFVRTCTTRKNSMSLFDESKNSPDIFNHCLGT